MTETPPYPWYLWVMFAAALMIDILLPVPVGHVVEGAFFGYCIARIVQLERM